MRATAAGCLIALGALLASSANAEDPGAVALVKTVTGKVSVMRDGAKINVEPGFELHKSDEVISEPNSTGGIVFKDGTLLTVGAGSDVQIRDYVFEPKDAKYAFTVYLARGSAIYSSGKIGKLSPESVSVSTPEGGDWCARHPFPWSRRTNSVKTSAVAVLALVVGKPCWLRHAASA